MNELTKRVLFALPAAAMFIWLAWLGGIYFNLLMGILAAGTIWEVDRLMKQMGRPSVFAISLILAAVLWVNESLPDIVVTVFAAATIVITTGALFLRSAEWSQRWLSTLFCAIYPVLGYFLAGEVRLLGSGQEGFWLILALFLMIWGNDVFAYFGGKSLGKRKLAPKISPNKTIEGFCFGFLGSVVGAAIAWSVAPDMPLTLLQLIPAAVIASFTGPAGDLIESRIKRLAGVKDSSSILPGHGGLFDRFDALILTAPFLYFYFTLFL